MNRTKLVNGVTVPMTVDEEATRDAEEAQWVADEPSRTQRAQKYDTDKAAVIQALQSATTVQGLKSAMQLLLTTLLR